LPSRLERQSPSWKPKLPGILYSEWKKALLEKYRTVEVPSPSLSGIPTYRDFDDTGRITNGFAFRGSGDEAGYAIAVDPAR
jgi:hypothetical protein